MGAEGIASYDVGVGADVGTVPPAPGLAALLAPVDAATFAPALAPLANPAAMPELLTGAASRLPTHEQQLIVQVARAKGVDPRALAAIRLAENGGPGREFGVLSVLATAVYKARVAQVGTFQAQAEVAADTLRANEARYRAATGLAPRDATGSYTREFWSFFGGRWAPIGAENDPGGLNQYWVANVTHFYEGSALA